MARTSLCFEIAYCFQTLHSVRRRGFFTQEAHSCLDTCKLKGGKPPSTLHKESLAEGKNSPQELSGASFGPFCLTASQLAHESSFPDRQVLINHGWFIYVKVVEIMQINCSNRPFQVENPISVNYTTSKCSLKCSLLTVSKEHEQVLKR